MSFTKERAGLEKKFFEMCVPVVRGEGLLLYDLEYVTHLKTLRLYVMNEATKSAVIEDCIKVDHALSAPFEANEWIPDGVVLEVSSPGVYRQLSAFEHYKMSIGETILILITSDLDLTLNPQLSKKFVGQRKLRGELEEIGLDRFTLMIEKEKVVVKFSQVKKSQIDPDMDRLMNKDK